MGSKSFVIHKEELTVEQLNIIRNHKLCVSNIEEFQEWIIEENESIICGYTELDCINLPSLLKYAAGIDDRLIVWGNGLNDIKIK